ncbi:hypothetical protein OKJ48_03070 [Streptomyces kunmingensis]|uniref:Uncharacterized protein n=1 Tax=Streptomyces kunmingensis TaxID=68225 RepID=A0ABU6C5Z2_9ACTN|nr:hypothetical protein [Streptomyces kunmingensis]MEB3959240.1 hypothetical protein [Streptomyces kunmingensis]
MARKNRGTGRRWPLWGNDRSIEALDQEHRAERGMSGDREVRAETVRARLYATSTYLTAAT